MGKLLIVASFWVLAGCIPRPSDPVEVGELCLPSRSDCDDQVVLIRPSVGRNQLDFSVTNVGTEEVRIVAYVINPSVIEFDPDLSSTEDIITQKVFPNVGSGKTVSDRFTPRVLGTREDLRFLVTCDGCELSVDYVFETTPLECFEDEDCTSSWVCDDRYGHCAECITNDDCNQDQTCDSLRARCTPEDTTPSCNTSPGGPFALWYVFGFLLLIVVRRRHLRVACFTLPLLFWASTSAASPPEVGMSIGGGFRFLTGELGEDAQRGIGLSLSQELRWKYIGGAVSLGTSFYQTTQAPPPFSRGVQLYNVSIGPRGYLPFGKFDLHAGADLRRFGFLSNSLVRVTGTETNFTAIGGLVGFRYHFDRIVFKFETRYSPFFGLPGGVLAFDFSVGFGAGR